MGQNYLEKKIGRQVCLRVNSHSLLSAGSLETYYAMDVACAHGAKKLCTVGMHNAKQRNDLKSPNCSLAYSVHLAVSSRMEKDVPIPFCFPMCGHCQIHKG